MRFRKVAAISILMIGATAGGYMFWYRHRPHSPDAEKVLFRGVKYKRISRLTPRPLVIHLVQIDLKEPGIAFTTTPGKAGESLPFSASLTTDFLKDCKCQIAINADFFEPWHSNGILDYYPHPGDPCKSMGLSACQGRIICKPTRPSPTLFISEQNEVSFKPAERLYNAVAGDVIFVDHGQVSTERIKSDYHGELHPRTAVFLDHSARYLSLLVVDGRQPGYSEGVSIEELGKIAVENGAWTALNLDGGGSTTLAAEGAGGDPETLNSPIDKRIVNRERPVANHLGVFARR